MKSVYIFLDVDGVLNHAGCEHWKNAKDELLWQVVCTDNVSALNALVDALCVSHKVTIVLSSTWRRLMTLEEFNNVMADNGFRYTVSGKTPPTSEKLRSRGSQIQAYLDTLAEKPDAIVILDDDPDMDHLMPCLVQTYFGTGIQEQDDINLLGLRLRHVFQALKKVDIQLAALEG